MSEQVHTIAGVEGLLTRIVWPHGKTFMHQKFMIARQYNGGKSKLVVELRFDDNPENGHNTFAATATEYEKDKRGHWRGIAGGCMHEEIAKIFPEFAQLLPWHLVSTDGPMHYLANTVYMAGDRDHWGRRAGEPSAWEHFVYFGNSPVSHQIGAKFYSFLQSRMTQDQDGGHYVNREHGEFRVVAIAYEERTGQSYKFGPKYTLVGFGDKWHECPFRSEIEAQEFAAGLNTCRVLFVENATAFSDGKARDLTAARSIAVWPDATDEELMQEPEALKEALAARLPVLLAQFRKDMESCGFQWSTKPE